MSSRLMISASGKFFLMSQASLKVKRDSLKVFI